MKMKKIYEYMLVAALTVLPFCSCSRWLDIIPEDTTTETNLFKDAAGYHSALNGIYQTLAGEQLY